MSDHKSESGFQYSITNLKPADPEHKITLTFPDGARRQYPKDITGLEVAKGISPSLAKRTVAMALDGELADLNEAIRVMENSDLVAEALGEHVFDFFLRNKREEWADYRRQVTRFELDRYLPML